MNTLLEEYRTNRVRVQMFKQVKHFIKLSKIDLNRYEKFPKIIHRKLSEKTRQNQHDFLVFKSRDKFITRTTYTLVHTGNIGNVTPRATTFWFTARADKTWHNPKNWWHNLCSHNWNVSICVCHCRKCLTDCCTKRQLGSNKLSPENPEGARKNEDCRQLP